MNFTKHCAVAGGLLAALALAACGSASDSPAPRTKLSTAEIARLPQFEIKARSGPVPTELEVRDVRKGSGAVARPGDTFLLDWAEVSYGKPLEASPHREGQPQNLAFDNMLAGWEQGMPGMRVGGRRELIVPPRLGDLPTTMVYQIDLLAIERPGAQG